MNFRHLFFFFLTVILVLSCATTKLQLDVPDQIKSRLVETVKIKGVKGKGIPGSRRRLKFDHSYSGTLQEGWKISTDIFDKTPGGFFSAEATRRSLLSSIGLDVNDVVSKTSDTYQFSLSDAGNSVLIFCNQQYTAKSTSYKADRKADVSIARQQASKFAARIYPVTNAELGEWHFEMGYDRETPGGVMSTIVREGLPEEKGFLTNQTDTIFIESLYIKKGKAAKQQQTVSDILNIVGGYAFKLTGHTIGIVDMFNASLSFSTQVTPAEKLLIAAAGTGLLLRSR